MQAVEGGSGEATGMGPAFEQHAGHLDANHGKFLSHWLRLVAMEEEYVAPRRAEIWTLSGRHSLNSNTGAGETSTPLSVGRVRGSSLRVLEVQRAIQHAVETMVSNIALTDA